MLAARLDDDSRSPRWPWISALLAALWLAVFAAAAEGRFSAAEFGLHPDAVGFPGALTFFALHASEIHLAVGLALLALAGPVLEARWGHGLFALFLILAIAGGAAATLFATGGSTRPIVGASAALAALVGAAAVRSRRRGLTLRIGFGRFSFDLWLPAFTLPIAWIAGGVAVRATDVAAPVTAGVDVPAQVALAVAGGVLAGLIGWSGLEERWLGRRERAARDRLVEARIRLARNEWDAGRPDQSYEILEAALAAFPDPRIVSVLVEVATVCGRRGDALTRGARAVKDAWHDGYRDLASRLWLPLVRIDPDLSLDMRLRLALAPMLKAAGLAREAALTLRGELRGKGRTVTPGTALRIADAARSVHPPTAIEAARIALASDGLDEAKRARLEAWIEAVEADPQQLVATDLDASSEKEPAAASGDARPRRRKDDPEPVDPHALALPEASDALELDAPRAGERVEEVDDPHAVALEADDPDPPTR